MKRHLEPEPCLYAIHEAKIYRRSIICETKELIGLEPTEDPNVEAAFGDRRRIYKTKHAHVIFRSAEAAWQAAIAAKKAEIDSLKVELETHQAEPKVLKEASAL